MTFIYSREVILNNVRNDLYIYMYVCKCCRCLNDSVLDELRAFLVIHMHLQRPYSECLPTSRHNTINSGHHGFVMSTPQPRCMGGMITKKRYN